MDADYSKAALERFLDIAEKQGFFNANTLASTRSAVVRLLEDVQPDLDVRKIDVEAATIRYHNKHPGDLSPPSLRTYQSRLARLIKEFVKYNDDPTGYKPFSKPKNVDTDRPARPARNERARQPVVVEQEQSVTDVIPVETTLARTTPTAMAMQYPLRQDFIAQVLLPRGMTSDEARRLCAFIRTLAVDFVPET